MYMSTHYTEILFLKCTRNYAKMCTRGYRFNAQKTVVMSMIC